MSELIDLKLILTVSVSSSVVNSNEIRLQNRVDEKFKFS